MNKEEAKKQIDSIINHIEWRHGGGTDYVKDDRMAAHKIIDDLTIDRPKVKLPREVGEAWIEYVDSRQTVRDVDKLDMALILLIQEKCPDDNVQSWYTVTPGALAILADAYRYGWEAELEELFYVKAPENWDHRWAWKSAESSFKGCVRWKDEPELNKARYEQFTRAELKQYHLDSDIFTLVPVGAEK